MLRLRMYFPQADAPNSSLIPESDAVGVTVVLITCTYHGQEFIRVGYYVNNEYPDPELRENPPSKPDFSQVWPHCTSCFRLADSFALGGVESLESGAKVTS